MLRYATLPTVVAAVLIAGCGSSSPSSSDSGGSGTANNNANGIKFANCVRTHGVPSFPDPGGNGSGGIQIAAKARSGSGGSLSVNGVSVSAPAFQAAMQACKSYLPNGGTPPPGAVAKARKAALQFAACMRAHGVPNFPDPQIGTGPGGGVAIRISGPGSAIDRSAPAFKSAQAACGSIVGKGFAQGAGVQNKP